MFLPSVLPSVSSPIFFSSFSTLSLPFYLFPSMFPLLLSPSASPVSLSSASLAISPVYFSNLLPSIYNPLFLVFCLSSLLLSLSLSPWLSGGLSSASHLSLSISISLSPLYFSTLSLLLSPTLSLFVYVKWGYRNNYDHCVHRLYKIDSVTHDITTIIAKCCNNPNNHIQQDAVINSLPFHI